MTWLKKIVAVTGEYINREGQQKAEFTEIGVVGISQNGKEYMLLDPTVSIAGVLAKQNALAVKRGEQASDMVMCSMVEQQNNQQQQQGYPQQQQYQGQPQQQAQQQPPQQYQAQPNGY